MELLQKKIEPVDGIHLSFSSFICNRMASHTFLFFIRNDDETKHFDLSER